MFILFLISSRRRHTRLTCDWSSDVCSSDLLATGGLPQQGGTQLQQRGRQRRGARDDGGKHGIGHGDRHLKAPGGNATTVARRGAARGRKIAILVTGGAVASVRRERGCAREALEPALEGTGVVPEQLQSELGPSPQDVLGRARELLAGEVLDLALVELRQELAPEIGERAGGPEHALEKGTIGVRAAQPEPRREVGVAPLDRAQEHGEAAPRQLAPREPGARRPGRAAGAESGDETVHRL